VLRTHSFDDARAYVEAMIETGEPFEAIEQAIAESSLPEDEASALWLVAWSLGDRRRAPYRREPLRLVAHSD
jgi:hypothetical protein